MTMRINQKAANTTARTLSILAAAVAGTAAIYPYSADAAVTVDGAITAGEYGAALVSQNTPTGFGNNQSELNQAFGNYVPGGALELALTGNLEGNGNGVVIFIDSKAGGAIANSFGGGYGQFGSVGGARIDDWGTDTDGGAGVSPTPGGGSVLAPNFNPDYALEINANGGGASYFINVIDLTVPNEPNANRDVFLGSGTTNSAAAVTQMYLRDGGFTDTGDVTHSFNNTNTAGVNGYDFGTPPARWAILRPPPPALSSSSRTSSSPTPRGRRFASSRSSPTAAATSSPTSSCPASTALATWAARAATAEPRSSTPSSSATSSTSRSSSRLRRRAPRGRAQPGAAAWPPTATSTPPASAERPPPASPSTCPLPWAISNSATPPATPSPAARCR
ncbi:MAG: hypothetical protein ABIP55_12655 [Tepidisphaeraceae bacterium]